MYVTVMAPVMGYVRRHQHANPTGAATEPFLKRLSELPSTDEEYSQAGETIGL
jgi:hypothetical protein